MKENCQSALPNSQIPKKRQNICIAENISPLRGLFLTAEKQGAKTTKPNYRRRAKSLICLSLFGAKKRHLKATMSLKACEVLIILLIENCLACYADRSWVHYADTKSAAGFCSIFVVNKGA